MTGANLPVIPETITVHLGAPDAAAQNVRVPFADYIKNVASSEIYPTWPESAIRANILAQISFALNRIYTEYYPSRGYDFDITSSTAYDQSFVYGRDIFDNISEMVDAVFSDYLRRSGNVEPLFAQYCNGTTVSCTGLSQWGSVSLAEEGYSPLAILRYYFGEDVELVEDAPIAGISESYPGVALRPGVSGNEVRSIQLRLNRISKNYPSIPKIPDPDGIFGDETEAAVREFQRIFSLTPDGIVGRGTWYAILRIYNAVKRLSEITSEGLPLSEVSNLFQTTLREGDTGGGVRELQYLLAFVGVFLDSIPSPAIDGQFGPGTRAAVEAFQRYVGLPVTGVVDSATWLRLYNTYRGQLSALPDDYFSTITEPYPGFQLRAGSEGEEVRTLQEYLAFVAGSYTAIPRPEPDGVFGARTREAVEAFQREFGIPVSGVVGSTTWDTLASVYLDLVESERASGTQYTGGTQ